MNINLQFYVDLSNWFFKQNIQRKIFAYYFIRFDNIWILKRLSREMMEKNFLTRIFFKRKFLKKFSVKNLVLIFQKKFFWSRG